MPWREPSAQILETTSASARHDPLMASFNLVAIGALYLDVILTVSHFPGEDEKLRASSLVRRRGGNGPNMLGGYSANTASVAYDVS